MNHELLEDAESYFNLDTLPASNVNGNELVWLRMEPFILHVCCKALKDAQNLLAAGRAAGFKNVGIQGVKNGKVMVAIWGDEGLDIPVTMVDMNGGNAAALSVHINAKMQRNWEKIGKLTESFNTMVARGSSNAHDESEMDTLVCPNCSYCCPASEMQGTGRAQGASPPRHFDVVGDIAIVHAAQGRETEASMRERGQAIMKVNRKIKVVVARGGKLESEKKFPSLMSIVAGRNRSPLMTSHKEFGVTYVIDLGRAFFTARMGMERLRITQQIGRGEKVLVLFCGCGPEVLQIADKTQAAEIVAVDINPHAISCARRGLSKLMKKHGDDLQSTVKILEADALQFGKEYPAHFDRVLVPRPKGVDPGKNGGGGDQGLAFLNALLPTLRDGAEVHWYDFAADHEPRNVRERGNFSQTHAGRRASSVNFAFWLRR